MDIRRVIIVLLGLYWSATAAPVIRQTGDKEWTVFPTETSTIGELSYCSTYLINPGQSAVCPPPGSGSSTCNYPNVQVVNPGPTNQQAVLCASQPVCEFTATLVPGNNSQCDVNACPSCDSCEPLLTKACQGHYSGGDPAALISCMCFTQLPPTQNPTESPTRRPTTGSPTPPTTFGPTVSPTTAAPTTKAPSFSPYTPGFIVGEVNLNQDTSNFNSVVVGSSVGVLCGVTTLVIVVSCFFGI